MDKQKLFEQKEQLEQKLASINAELAKVEEMTLYLKDATKPFKKWNLADRNNLYNFNIDAFMWLQEHIEATIEEYNAQSAIKDRVIYE